MTQTIEDLRKASQFKMEWMEREYWRLRNGKTDAMRCPYCSELNVPGEQMCCDLFKKAFAAILERQDAIDSGMQAAQQVQFLLGKALNGNRVN